MALTALHFGAGNIGRGFIGALLSQSGYNVIFADIVETLINALNEQHSYTVKILDVNQNIPPQQITNVSGVMPTNPEELRKAILSADIITTAVGACVLGIIANSLADGIAQRRKAGKSYLNIIACENMTGNSSHLRHEILKCLKDEDDRVYMDQFIGFPNCTVDRIAPPVCTSPGENILSVGVELFYEWIVERPAFRGPVPNIKGMDLTDNLMAFVQRKLFTLNCGHATVAYMGYLKGYSTIDQALKDPKIEDAVRKTMLESGAALCKKHKFNEDDHKKYIERILNRFRNPYLKDDVARVGRDPLRKLGRADRLVGPTKMAAEFGLPHEYLTKSIAACLMYNNPQDNQSVELQNEIEDRGVEYVCQDLLGFEGDSPETKMVVKNYEELKKAVRA